jgi:hypothetical protein
MASAPRQVPTSTSSPPRITPMAWQIPWVSIMTAPKMKTYLGYRREGLVNNLRAGLSASTKP